MMLTIDLNLKNRVNTQYTNFNFNSMVKFNGQYLGASDSGLFNLSGDDDSGTPIDAYFIMATTDFGILNVKRFRYFYFGLEAAQDLVLTLSTEKVEAYDYDVVLKESGIQQALRVPIRRDMYGAYWTVKIANTNGGDFSLDRIKGLPVVRNHGIY